MKIALKYTLNPFVFLDLILRFTKLNFRKDKSPSSKAHTMPWFQLKPWNEACHWHDKFPALQKKIGNCFPVTTFDYRPLFLLWANRSPYWVSEGQDTLISCPLHKSRFHNEIPETKNSPDDKWMQCTMLWRGERNTCHTRGPVYLGTNGGVREVYYEVVTSLFPNQSYCWFIPNTHRQWWQIGLGFPLRIRESERGMACWLKTHLK